MSHLKGKATGTAAVALGVVVAAAIVVMLATMRAQAQVPAGPCRLTDAGSENLPSATCRSCHPWGDCHPVDVDYERAAASGRFDLHPAEDAVRRGAFLPEGQVRCVSCHDRHSSVPYHLAIRNVPPPPRPPEAVPATAAQDVALKALCVQCHARD